MSEEEEQEEMSPEKILGVYEGGRNTITGEREGQGVNRFPNGDIYKGEYKKGVRQGPGKYFWKKPIAKYSGTYENHKKEGYGLMKYPDGSSYDGQFHEGRRHGDGTYTYPNGDTYIGQWENGKKHGKGTHTFKQDGNQYIGVWRAGQIIRGVWKIKDGSYYVGQFDKQRPNVEGRYVMVNGNSITGTFKEETKSFEVPIEKEPTEQAEEAEEQAEEANEPQMRKVEKISLRQFIPQVLSQSTPATVEADFDIQIQEGELDLPPEPEPKKEGEEEEEQAEEQ
ncbi:putative Phosphatidylinositol 4-phosphate 5-kinase 5 [Blattamonas nauphoetae]|uniref:Phosphatidylinositol 4-phosphate 5-kinase 5 n=1 Tax=Blattamonas nauphoetae TaxID=2049346 RepID=A0ABQ9Y1P7_9EUKA|nr:putative Phosphatidylinositol 4-phosphate 5-kinase 5 [Blattamonas nauphoetae]